jgi:hypothetical protein
MRMSMLAVSVLAMFGFAAGQVSVTPSGFASNRFAWEPTVPLVTTPVVSLPNPIPQVGASNATLGNAAGATSAAEPNLGVTGTVLALPAMPALPVGQAAAAPVPIASNDSRAFDWGAAEFNSAYDFPDLAGRSLAELAAQTRSQAQRPAKVFTNDDVERLKQQAPQPKPGTPSSPPRPQR